MISINFLIPTIFCRRDNDFDIHWLVREREKISKNIVK